MDLPIRALCPNCSSYILFPLSFYSLSVSNSNRWHIYLMLMALLKFLYMLIFILMFIPLMHSCWIMPCTQADVHSFFQLLVCLYTLLSIVSIPSNCVVS